MSPYPFLSNMSELVISVSVAGSAHYLVEVFLNTITSQISILDLDQTVPTAAAIRSTFTMLANAYLLPVLRFYGPVNNGQAVTYSDGVPITLINPLQITCYYRLP